MLNELILVPDVFDPAAYTAEGACGAHLSWLRRVLLEEAIVRDLRGGGWGQFCLENRDRLHRSVKELIIKLDKTNRLRSFPAKAADAEWLDEALAAHAAEPATVVVTTANAPGPKDQQVSTIEKLPSSDGWRQGSAQSRRPTRSTAHYLELLQPVLRQARSVMFIDPYLDPSKDNYKDFGDLLMPLAEREKPPIIEIYRSAADRDGTGSKVHLRDGWRQKFEPLHRQLEAARLTAEVFIWNHFHDRFLISDVIGISVSAGFDVTAAAERAVWTRLGREVKDDIQREFAGTSRVEQHPHKPRFAIGYGA